jgi:hypothetical protein
MNLASQNSPFKMTSKIIHSSFLKFSTIFFLLFLLIVTINNYSPLIKPKNIDSFYSISSRIGTDKVTSHNYPDAYEFFLTPHRHNEIRLLEIGLGCHMADGPGKSLAVVRIFHK